MITLAWYLLKVIICSGILCGYYYISLRNKIFHRWNRFYLLASVVLALSVPLMKINFFHDSSADKGTVLQMLQTINNSDEIIIEYSRHNGLQLSSENIIGAIYLLITIAFLATFFLALYRIYRLKRKYPEIKMKGINFISTDAKGTPFSFFKSIFWNNAIDLHSKHGQQIFNHEIAHVKEKHSYDKIFMNVVLIFFWVNPFFWLMRKELGMIHEFIADKESMEGNDVNAFAETILQTVYPGQNFSLTNNFFHSPLKRRLIMFTKNKNPRVSYLSRLLVLPLAAVVIFAFTLKIKTVSPANFYSGQTITVVIDAGHGGEDNGAIASNGVKEKDINLSIAKKIAALNSNDHINILLSRDNDQLIPVKERVEFAKAHHSDLFISIHINAVYNGNPNESGFSVLIDKNNTDKNKLLASALIQELKKSYTTNGFIGVRKNGVWVLDNNICPAALIECGYLSYPADEAFITNNSNQEKIARNILDAIEKYADNAGNTKPAISEASNDSLPNAYYHNKKIERIDGLGDTSKIKLTYTDGMQETITMEQAKKGGLLVLPPPPPLPPAPPPPPAQNEPAPPPPPAPPLPRDVLYVVDGKMVTADEAKKIHPNNIQSIHILKGENAEKKYAEKGRKGVVEIIMKPGSFSQNDSIPDKVFTKVENEASFPGGHAAWIQYVTHNIKASIDSFTNKDFGTCIVKFIVLKDGRVSNVQATTMENTQLAKVAVNTIKTGPRWIPATQNNLTVDSYRLQPVTLSDPEKISDDSGKNEPK
ncbi:MAG: N-acetylmuramoyl-L-alanine amidase [Ginsengibacter sp.]